jgi:hypothetical protein
VIADAKKQKARQWRAVFNLREQAPLYPNMSDVMPAYHPSDSSYVA